MEIYNKYIRKYYSELILVSILFLFFFQLISDFIESIYALNLIEVELNENIAAALFLLSPIILVLPIFKKEFPDKGLVIIGEVMVICRILEPIFNTQIKMIFTGMGVFCFMLFFPAFLQSKSKGNEEKNSLLIGVELSIGLGMAILFRTLGSTLDLTYHFWFLWIGWVLAAIAGIMLINFLNTDRMTKIFGERINSSDPSHIQEKKGSKWKILGLSLGITSILVLIYFAFSSPVVISRWTEGNYTAITIFIIIAITAFIFLVAFKPDIINIITFRGILFWNGLFVLMLVLTIGVHQIPFLFISSYPVYAPTTTLLHHIPLYIMLILSPIILIDFTLLTRELFRSKPSIRKIGVSFFISSVYLLLMIFSAVFTIVWDYVPYVGAFFRDMIWFVFLVVGLVIALPILLVRKDSLLFTKQSRNKFKSRLKISGLIFIICIGTILGVAVLEKTDKEDDIDNPIRILSYNIQQGFDENGDKNFEGQYEVIKNANASIIGLQESDTCRISSGNADIVRYVNNRLKYYSYFGPKTITGTYGIALLSRYPIKNAKTFYMESEGEQTATIEAKIIIGTITYNVFVTHLGNFIDPTIPPFDRSQIIQQEQLLERIGSKTNVILMGDFNFQPYTEQYNITIVHPLDDCWQIANSTLIGDVPNDWVTRLPAERIDHVFISPDLTALSNYVEVTYFGGSAADHPAVLTSISI
ncbi:MAG: endonuclease/exonuclease/phosphatase family protein [Promethearchaeota archaeon]